MTIKSFMLLLLLPAPFLFSQSRPPENENSIRERAKAIHNSVITIDTHNDIEVQNFTEEVNYTSDLDTQVNLPKMESGGLDASWLIVFTAQGSLDDKGYKVAYENAISKFEAIHRLTEIYAPEQIQLALTAEDVIKIHDQGKKVALIGVENGYPIGEDLSRIEAFYKRGARYMSLAHNGHNQLSDSHTGEKDDVWLHNGLSDMGKKAVAEMNRLGIMIDLSHPSRQSNIQVLKLTKAPVIASHSSARSLCDVSRNLDDEVLKMIGKNGGVVQTVAFPGYVNAEKYISNENASLPIYKKVAQELNLTYLDPEDFEKLSGKELDKAFKDYDLIHKEAAKLKTGINKEFPLVNVKDFVDHIDYMVQLIGIDHVGISSDFDGGGGVEGWNNAAETFNITYELVKRGYTADEIGKLWGLNLLRVMRKVEEVSENIQKGKL